MGENPRGRGRGAAILEALRRAQTQPAQEEPERSVEEPSPPMPTAPRGRANLLRQKLNEMRQAATVGEEQVTSVKPTSDIPSITKAMETVQVTEPCIFQGESGTKVPTSCNYIRISTEEERGVFEYHVQFKPDVDAKHIRNHCVKTHFGFVRLFDSGSTLYLPTKLPDTRTEYQCTNPQDKSTEITMQVTFIKRKLMSESLHLFNILMKKIMYELRLTPIGRNFFDPHHSHLIPQHRLEVLPGYAVAVDEYEGGAMICLDTQHRVMRTENVLDYLKGLRLSGKGPVTTLARQALLGTTVMTKYNNKTYRIDEIQFDLTPMSTFETRDNRHITYVQYYQTQYNIEITDHKQPLLLNRKTKKTAQSEEVDQFICLVPELCNLTGLTDEMRADFKVMKDVAMYTRVTPAQRLNALRAFLDNIEKTPSAKQILSNWGMHIENATIDLWARVLSPEVILFGGGVKDTARNADWNSMVCKNRILGPMDLQAWYLFYTARDQQSASNFANTIVRLGDVMGMRIAKPRMQQLADDRTDTYANTIQKVATGEAQMLVFICPSIREDRYSVIKRLCCADMPIPTQVVLSRTLSNSAKVRGIIQKIALQMNCKLGGTLWALRFPVKNWMICGIDVYHSPGVKQSVCAFVSSLNDDITRWFSTVVFQDRELGDQHKTAFIKALERYRQMNGVFPTNVVIFRDGVGDGQLKHCKNYEVAQFQQCLKDYSISNVKLTMVVVQKRINTRIFLRKDSEFDNPVPGTIMDHTITRFSWYDFFLVAQHVRQGTVTPTHYVVVHDDAELKPDHVQKLTYKLCHLYYNWPGTIRVPAPCQYAHKLAYLVGQHIRREPSVKLADALYYL